MYINFPTVFFHFKNVAVSHATGLSQKRPMDVFRNGDPLMGPDGKIVRTSVCDEIDESVKRAAAIEQQLAQSKVFFLFSFTNIQSTFFDKIRYIPQPHIIQVIYFMKFILLNVNMVSHFFFYRISMKPMSSS